MAKEVIKQLVSENDVVSSSKVWFNIANIAITIVYLMLGYAVFKMSTPAIADFAWLTLVFAGVVTTNKFANKFLEYKYGGSPPTGEASKPEIKIETK